MDLTMTGPLVGMFIILGFGCARVTCANGGGGGGGGGNNHSGQQHTRYHECSGVEYRPMPGTGCKSYQECEHGQWAATTFNCPNSLLFNVGSQTCDWSYNIDFQTCSVSSSQGTEPSTSPASPSQTTQTSSGVDHFTQCGNKRCYHGTCYFDRHCYNNNCHHYNHHCNCRSGYTGESCSQQIDPVTSGLTSTSQTTAIPHHSPDLGRWQTCGHLHCYHASACSYECDHRDYYGRCTHYRNSQCTCYSGYTGQTCALKKVADGYCIYIGLDCHHGYCVEDLTTSKYACQCLDGSTGDNCQLVTGLNESTTVVPVTAEPPTTTTTTTTTTGTTTTTTTGTTTTTATTKIKTTKAPTTTTTTTTVPSSTRRITATTSSSSEQTLSTTLPILAVQHSCNPTKTVTTIISGTTIGNNDITSCPSGSSATPEAFVLAHCQIPGPSTWTEGINVMSQCQDIPLYTPVATFSNHRYSSSGGLSGIFMGCIPNGFKLGIQRCDQTPTILHVEKEGFLTLDADLYFTMH